MLSRSSNNRHINSAHRHFSFSYPVSFSQKIYSILLGPLFVVFILFLLVTIFSHFHPANIENVSLGALSLAILSTLGRMSVAYVFSLLFSVPLALLADKGPIFEKILLPVFDILESIPILAFFPVLLIVFLRFDFLNGAAIFILFLSMLWNIVFTAVGGLKMIPTDIKSAAHVFHIKGFDYFRKILLPAIIPELVTGSILAFAQGWNIIIVAEVLHTYIPHGTASQDLFGIGSILVDAAANGQNELFLAAIVGMVLVIAFLNFFVWQKLLHYAQRFRFE
jgi:NitT/TauT family transport system permease protein